MNESTQDLNRCAKCGMCLAHCPVYQDLLTEKAAPRGKIQLSKALRDEKLACSPGLQSVFGECLLCGACAAVCPSGMSAEQAVLTLRQELVERLGSDPRSSQLISAIQAKRNIAAEDNEDRAEWLEDLVEEDQSLAPEPGAEVLLFSGCVASFFPSVQPILEAMVKLMHKAGVKYNTLGGREWCCGFPLLGAGATRQLDELIARNQEEVRRLAPQSVVFTCPSCFRFWKSHYQTQSELLHGAGFLARLIESGKLKLKPQEGLTVTYHDPCDLGRHGGDYETPRRILQAIPGLRLLEMSRSREKARCCGGGGNLEVVNPELSGRLAREKLDMAMATGADAVVTACQQCVRTMASAAKRAKLDLEILDLTQLVLRAAC